MAKKALSVTREQGCTSKLDALEGYVYYRNEQTIKVLSIVVLFQQVAAILLILSM